MKLSCFDTVLLGGGLRQGKSPFIQRGQKEMLLSVSRDGLSCFRDALSASALWSLFKQWKCPTSSLRR